MTLEILIQNQSKSILEAGCGCGIFASMLYKSKYKVKYCGFDFSSVGLDRARKNCPNYKFIFDNIYTSQLYETHDYDTVISHEVLEHLNDDISFLRKLKKDTLLIASVPEFDCDSHVRYFTNENQILFRYKRCANIDKILYTDKMFLFYGKIK